MLQRSQKTLILRGLILLTLGLRAYELQAGEHLIKEGSLKLVEQSVDISGIRVDSTGGPSILRLKASPSRVIARCLTASPGLALL
jgi:hypothetical protein